MTFPSERAFGDFRFVLGPLLTDAYRPMLQPYSNTLARSVTIDVTTTPDVITFTSRTGYWWAGVLDQGRRAVSPTDAPFLVWFRDIADDPRVGGGTAYPRTYGAARKLTTAEFNRGAAINRQEGPDVERPFMVVSRSSRAFPGRRFTKAAEPVLSEIATRGVRDILVADLTREIQRMVDSNGLGGSR